jgi:hypothetical protein
MFLYPPRPERAVIPGHLPVFEGMGFSAEYKKNGTCTTIETDDGLKSWTRHNEPHKAWNINEFPAKDMLLKIEDSYFVAELLHSKGVGVKDTLYVFDILKYQGKMLTGMTLMERRAILHTLWPIQKVHYSHFEVHKNLWVARWFECGFVEIFNGITKIEDEGIVLKDPKATLLPCYKEGTNAGWQVKCRKPTKNYSF